MKPLLFLAVIVTLVAALVFRLPDQFDDDPHWRP